LSEKPRPERRRPARGAATRAQPARPRRAPAPRPRPAAGSPGAGFLDYLIIALLVVLAVMLVTGLVLLLRVL
jgi:hypothetical protein